MAYTQNNERVITQSAGDNRHPSWSPNGEQIVFESNRDGDWDLFLINENGDQERKLFNNETNDRNPSWHPNGEEILFESDRNGQFQLFSLNVKSDQVSLIELNRFNLEPTEARFSPDGKSIVFSANASKTGVNLNLYLTAHSGGSVEQLTFDTTRSFYPSWAPDSKQITFFSRRDTEGQNDELYTLSIDNPKITTRLTNYPMHDFCPDWSKDGKRIVFSRSVKDARPELQLINADGSGLRQLTFTLHEGETQAVWSPDNQHIAYAGYRNGSYEICILKVD